MNDEPKRSRTRDPAKLGSEPAMKHMSYRAPPSRLKRLRQAALERDMSLQRLLDEAVDRYIDLDRAADGEPTAEAAFADRMRLWRRHADEHDVRRLYMFLGWE